MHTLCKTLLQYETRFKIVWFYIS